MAPRGVAIPDVRERLFAAAERVLVREGPAGLTNRAITQEADCAKGLIHSHFTDLDDFVAQLVLNRFRSIAGEVGPLPARAGSGSVTGNMTTAALALLGSHGPAIAAAALSRPKVTERIRHAWAEGEPGPATAEQAMSHYLEAEQRLGRVVPHADCPALALAVAGTVHHLLMTRGSRPSQDTQLVEHLVAAVIGPATAA
ncbi:TetR/AcrR family transcriptional regulator [Streptomyces sodiiphilus]|uniref:TetR/AcrR family transcriptional regulator n=1 Tax=Streptomyces sodiiphilus TaxID=226217 RepID=A0ABN2PC30_9ACTN